MVVDFVEAAVVGAALEEAVEIGHQIPGRNNNNKEAMGMVQAPIVAEIFMKTIRK